MVVEKPGEAAGRTYGARSLAVGIVAVLAAAEGSFAEEAGIVAAVAEEEDDSSGLEELSALAVAGSTGHCRPALVG